MEYRPVELSRMDMAYRSPSLADSQASTMLGSRESDDDTTPLKQPNVRQSEEPEKVSRPKTLILQLFALAWVVPIIGLLFLNIKMHVLGASAWCPFGNCKPQIFAEDSKQPKRLSAQFERETHNFLGALQLAAKLLEVWFILVATWLVYLRTIHLAQRREGLPIGYISRPSEFAEIPSLFDKLLWTTLRGSRHGRRNSAARVRLWLYIVSTIALCVLANLMGPAVAVLVLPSLQWIETKEVVVQRFTSFNSDQPPSDDGFAVKDSGCWKSNFTQQQYSCSGWWANGMDSWVEATFARQGRDTAVASLQDQLSFSYNATWVATSNLTFPNGTHQVNRTYDTVSWSPSRQMVQRLSDDLLMIGNMSAGYEVEDPAGINPASTYDIYNNTVSTTIRRTGPILGALVNTWVGYNDSHHRARHFTIDVDWYRSVRCFHNYNLLNTPNCWGDCETAVNASYTRCITLGSGWNDGYKEAFFQVAGRYHLDTQDLGADAWVWHMASGHAAFLPDGKIPSDVMNAGFSEDCLDDKTVNSTTCNWNAFFNMTSTDPLIKPRSKTVNTLQVTWDMLDKTGLPNVVTFVVDFVAFQSFATYLLDPNPYTNPLYQIDTQIPFPADWQLFDLDPIAIDPSWTLAAWSIERDGTIDPARSAASRLQRLGDLFYGSPDTSDQDYSLQSEQYWLNAVALMPIMQTLSLIDFNTVAATVDEDDSDPRQPLLKRNARINVWAYGISSRTSYLGLAVVSCGIVVVLLEFWLGMKDRRVFRSPTQLLVAALEHTNSGEFNGLHRDQDIARIPFRLENDHLAAGRFRFEKT